MTQASAITFVAGSAPILAQDSIAVEAQIALFVQQLLSPAGIAGAVIGSSVLIMAMVFRKVMPITAGIALASVMFQLHPDALTHNVLLGPLQSFRYASKSVAFGLLVLAASAALMIPQGSRGRSTGFGTMTFYAFQVYYTVQLLLFAESGLVRGFFGVISITLMFVVFGVGFGRRMQSAESARDVLEIFAWLAVAFIGINLLQIAFGLGGALVGGRLAGIAGNAQMMGGISAMLLLANAYLYADLPPTRPLRYVSVACVGMLALLILATGSRTAVLTSCVGLAAMFRLQIGRVLALSALAGVALLVGSVFLDQSGGVERMLGAQNTRAEVWADALRAFANSPIVGNLPFSGDPDAVFSGVESTFLRTLANLGIIGGAVVLVPFGTMLLGTLRAFWLGRADPSYRRLSDFYIAGAAAILILNLFDGYAFGFLTFPAIYMYVIFTLGDFLSQQSRDLLSEELSDRSAMQAAVA